MALAPCKFGNFFQMVVVAGSLVAYKVKPGLHWKCVLYHKDQYGFFFISLNHKHISTKKSKVMINNSTVSLCNHGYFDY